MFFQCQSTEMLFYHAGTNMSIYVLPHGRGADLANLERTVLGPHIARGQVISFAVPANTWFTRLVEADSQEDYCVFSCCLAPGFHINDFKAEIFENIKNETWNKTQRWARCNSKDLMDLTDKQITRDDVTLSSYKLLHNSLFTTARSSYTL